MPPTPTGISPWTACSLFHINQCITGQLKIFAQLLFWKIPDIIEKLEEWQTSICSSLACMLSRFNCDQLFATLWTVAYQAPLSMGFSRKGYWSGFPCPPPGDLPDPEIKPVSLRSPAFAGGFLTPSHTWGIYQLLQSLIQLKFNPFCREACF